MWDQLDRIDRNDFYIYNEGDTTVYVYDGDSSEETRIEWDGSPDAELWQHGECFATVAVREPTSEEKWDKSLFRSVEGWKREAPQPQDVGTGAQPGTECRRSRIERRVAPLRRAVRRGSGRVFGNAPITKRPARHAAAPPARAPWPAKPTIEKGIRMCIRRICARCDQDIPTDGPELCCGCINQQAGL